MKPESKIRWMTAAAGGLSAVLVVYNAFCSPRLPGVGQVKIASPTSSAAPGPDGKTGGAGPTENRVNINTADLQELETIPGVGPEIAANIVEYRLRNGNFSCIEDIMKVSGIGDAKFKKMREMIIV